MDFIVNGFCPKNSNIPEVFITIGIKIMFTPFITVATRKESNLFKKSQ